MQEMADKRRKRPEKLWKKVNKVLVDAMYIKVREHHKVVSKAEYSKTNGRKETSTRNKC
ncbi:hypothetical protein [Oceanobacillus senegalensis]|uniref:hypothetical protein n=1 Tax=Oceanobacillus senegalensis TaxID=1936063 RepID=UPI001FE357AF|nr:hypothetical protein [Oceanobacillus senegalensis]